jgi:hypothetical protein
MYFRYFVCLLICSVSLAHLAQTTQKDQPDPHKEAILILTGFGSKYHSLQILKNYFETAAYDVYVPRYISRKSIDKTIQNLDEFWIKGKLDQYENIHVFAYIVGAWTLNEWVAQNGPKNIKSIVYDRSALQERAPYILISKYKIPNYFVFGPIMYDLQQTPYVPLNDSSIQKGLLLECYATGIVRKNQETAAQLGPYCFEPDCFAQQYQDAKYVPLNHDQMYTHPEIFGPALLHFFDSGNFGDYLQEFGPVADPFIKRKP